MKYMKVESYDRLSEIAKEFIMYTINKKNDAVIGFATGSTPIGLYKKLVEEYKKGNVSFKNIKTFNLDEYYGLNPENDQSYRYFMNENLFNHIDLNPENINFLNGLAQDVEKECFRYGDLLKDYPIDIQILGIGQNGHIAFNEPGETFTKNTHLVELTESTINANSRFFEKIEDVPTQALTMGIGDIFKAKRLLVLANGLNKKEAVEKMLSGPITPKVPASILQLHSDVIVIYTEEKV